MAFTMMLQTETVRPDATALLVECRRRFPMAWKSSGVVLPAGDYERRAMCAFNVAGLNALASTVKGVKSDEAARIKTAADRLIRLVTNDEVASHNPSASSGQVVSRELVAGLPRGNLLGILKACEATFPA